jgi:DNA invertase Pin-like site-specific DNA recombinase
MCFIRAYLRASTDEQDAARARSQVEAFAREPPAIAAPDLQEVVAAADRGMQIAAWYVENESGAKLTRPELFRLLSDSHPGDVLLVEQVDRLSRLNAADWDRLKVDLKTRQVRVVALDLPTSWVMATGKVDDFTARMFAAINDMMLDMLAAVARKDYEDRRRRQMQGQAKAKAEGKYVGRPREQAPQCPHRRHYDVPAVNMALWLRTRRGNGIHWHAECAVVALPDGAQRPWRGR